MKVDFYISNPHEIFVFENLWKALREKSVEADFVVEPPGINGATIKMPQRETNGRNGVNTDVIPLLTRDAYRFIITTLEKREYCFRNLGNYGADAVVTTQNAGLLDRYKDSLKIKVHAGVASHIDDKGYSEGLSDFDAIFVHGEFQRKKMDKLYSIDEILVTGYPMFAPFHRGEIDRNEYIKYFGIDPAKKTIVYFSTRGEDNTVGKFGIAIAELTRNYNVIYKPHYNNLLFEPGRIEPLRNAETVFVDMNSCNPVPCLAVADMVLSDIRSTALTEAALISKPVLGLSNNNNPADDKLFEIVEESVPICRDALELDAMVTEHLENDIFYKRRYEMRRLMYTEFYGYDDIITAAEMVRMPGKKNSEKLNGSNKIAAFPPDNRIAGNIHNNSLT